MQFKMSAEPEASQEITSPVQVAPSSPEEVASAKDATSAEVGTLLKDPIPTARKVKRKKKRPKVPDRALPIAVDMPEFKYRARRTRMMRLPASKLLDEDAEDAGFCELHWKKVVTMSVLIGAVTGAYLLCTGDGPVAQMFNTLVEQSVEIFGFKEIPANDTDAFGWQYIDVTQRAPLTAATEPDNDNLKTIKTLKPILRAPRPSQALPTAEKTINGNTYYFYQYRYTFDMAMKICYERHNKSRLLYIADKDEGEAIVDWYYNEVYNNIKTDMTDTLMRLVRTAGFIDYRKDYTTVKPLYKTTGDELARSGRWKWLGAGASVVSMQNAAATLCPKWLPDNLQEEWINISKARKGSDLVFYAFLNMVRSDNKNAVPAGCISWLRISQEDIVKWPAPFICKRMTRSNFPDDDTYACRH